MIPIQHLLHQSSSRITTWHETNIRTASGQRHKFGYGYLNT